VSASGHSATFRLHCPKSGTPADEDEARRPTGHELRQAAGPEWRESVSRRHLNLRLVPFRSIQRDMAAEWLKLAESVRHRPRSTQMQME
jgi:hypothetical protein